MQGCLRAPGEEGKYRTSHYWIPPRREGRRRMVGNTTYAHLNWCLLIRRLLIFDSSVVRGIPSFPAAPDGPEIRPRLSSRAALIISFSRFANVAARVTGVFVPRVSECSQVSSMENVSPSHRITALSTTFCN